VVNDPRLSPVNLGRESLLFPALVPGSGFRVCEFLQLVGRRVVSITKSTSRLDPIAFWRARSRVRNPNRVDPPRPRDRRIGPDHLTPDLHPRAKLRIDADDFDPTPVFLSMTSTGHGSSSGSELREKQQPVPQASEGKGSDNGVVDAGTNSLHHCASTPYHRLRCQSSIPSPLSRKPQYWNDRVCACGAPQSPIPGPGPPRCLPPSTVFEY